MFNISAVGFSMWISATNTFPLGFEVSDFADDVDPFELPEVPLGVGIKDLNGRVFFQNVAPIIPMYVNVIANSPSDKRLQTLYNSNLSASNKISNSDIITLMLKYNGKRDSLYGNGKMLIGTPDVPIQARGRYRSRRYGFVFGAKMN